MREGQKLKNAKKLRQDMTEAETKLWYHLRASRFHGVKFKRQVPIGNYICDFVAVRQKLVIELDGGQHVTNTLYDLKRDAFLKQQGYIILRFWNDEALGNVEAVLRKIFEHIESPLPNPLP